MIPNALTIFENLCTVKDLALDSNEKAHLSKKCDFLRAYIINELSTLEQIRQKLGILSIHNTDLEQEFAKLSLEGYPFHQRLDPEPEPQPQPQPSMIDLVSRLALSMVPHHPEPSPDTCPTCGTVWSEADRAHLEGGGPSATCPNPACPSHGRL